MRSYTHFKHHPPTTNEQWSRFIDFPSPKPVDVYFPFFRLLWVTRLDMLVNGMEVYRYQLAAFLLPHISPYFPTQQQCSNDDDMMERNCSILLFIATFLLLTQNCVIRYVQR